MYVCIISNSYLNWFQNLTASLIGELHKILDASSFYIYVKTMF